MQTRSILSLVLVLLVAPYLGAQTTQPAIDARDPWVELRANQAFNRGEYAAALPLLTALADVAKDEPSRLGAIQEKMRVCQRALDALKANPSADTQPALAPKDLATDPETTRCMTQLHAQLASPAFAVVTAPRAGSGPQPAIALQGFLF